MRGYGCCDRDELEIGKYDLYTFRHLPFPLVPGRNPLTSRSPHAVHALWTPASKNHSTDRALFSNIPSGPLTTTAAYRDGGLESEEIFTCLPDNHSWWNKAIISLPRVRLWNLGLDCRCRLRRFSSGFIRRGPSRFGWAIHKTAPVELNESKGQPKVYFG